MNRLQRDDREDSRMVQKTDDDIECSPAYYLLEKTSWNLFITGNAGTGKSELLKRFRDNCKKNIIVLAPTGLSAVNIGGETIHSFFKLAPKIATPDEILKKRFKPLYEKTDIILIDEISMVRSDLFDAMDRIMRDNRDHNLPFGGARVIVFGDLMQLPPVCTKDEENILSGIYPSGSYYFFDSRSFPAMRFKIITLHKNYRQSERDFTHFLDKLRIGDISEEDLAFINRRADDCGIIDEKSTIISTKNDFVNRINSQKLQDLKGDSYFFETNVENVSKEYRYSQDDLSGQDRMLELKIGARVIFTKNDPDKRFFNGSLGTVTAIKRESIEVIIDGNSDSTQITQVTQEKLRYNFDMNTQTLSTNVLAKITQYPLRLGWAITIHKSQGQTFNRAFIDITRSPWENGQLYVALSRCRTLDGLSLSRKIEKKDIKSDRNIISFITRYDSFIDFPDTECSVTISGADENLTRDALDETMAEFSGIGLDFTREFSLENDRLKIRNRNDTRCAACSYMIDLISRKSEESMNKGVSMRFENCPFNKRPVYANRKTEEMEKFKEMMKIFEKMKKR